MKIDENRETLRLLSLVANRQSLGQIRYAYLGPKTIFSQTISGRYNAAHWVLYKSLQILTPNIPIYKTFSVETNSNKKANNIFSDRHTGVMLL